MHLSGLILVTEVSGVCAYQTASFSFSSGVALCAERCAPLWPHSSNRGVWCVLHTRRPPSVSALVWLCVQMIRREACTFAVAVVRRRRVT